MSIRCKKTCLQIRRNKFDLIIYKLSTIKKNCCLHNYYRVSSTSLNHLGKIPVIESDRLNGRYFSRYYGRYYDRYSQSNYHTCFTLHWPFSIICLIRIDISQELIIVYNSNYLPIRYILYIYMQSHREVENKMLKKV